MTTTPVGVGLTMLIAMLPGTGVWSDMTVLRAAVQLIPGGFGSALDVLVSGRATRIEQKRLLDTLQRLNADLAANGSTNLDKHFLTSEECHDFLQQGAEAAMRARAETHRIILARVMASGLTGRLWFKGDPTSLMHALGELSPTEVELLGVIFHHFEEHPDSRLEEGVLRGILPEEWSGSVEFLLKRIERTGLLAQYVGTGAIGDAPGRYHLTSMGKRLRALVTQPF